MPGTENIESRDNKGLLHSLQPRGRLASAVMNLIANLNDMETEDIEERRTKYQISRDIVMSIGGLVVRAGECLFEVYKVIKYNLP